MAAEDAAPARAAVQIGLLAWLVHRSRTPRWAVLLGGLLLAAAPTAWLLWRQAGLQRELVAARASLRPPATPPPPTAPAPDPRLAEELQRQAAATDRLRGELDRLARPQAAVLVSLGLVRGEGTGPEVPGLRLDAAAPWIVLSVELPPAGHPAWRATLLDAKGRVLWQGDRLAPSLYETLLINVPTRFLPPGGYRLRLEGLPAGAAPVPAGELPFRILPPT